MKKRISLFLALCVAVASMAFVTASAATGDADVDIASISPVQTLLVDALSWDGTARTGFATALNALAGVEGDDPATLALNVPATVTAVKALIPDNTVSDTVFVEDTTNGDTLLTDALTAFVNRDWSTKEIYVTRELPQGYTKIQPVADTFTKIRHEINEQMTGDAANDNGVKFVMLFLREATLVNYALVKDTVTTDVDKAALGVYRETGSNIDFALRHGDIAAEGLLKNQINDLIEMVTSLKTLIGSTDKSENYDKFVAYTETTVNGTGEEKAFYEYIISNNPNYNDLAQTAGDTSDDIALKILVFEAAQTGGGGGGSYLPTTEEYTVKFDAGENADVVGNAEIKVKDGKKPTGVPTAECNVEGYTFAGWSVDGETIVKPEDIAVKADVTYIAMFTDAEGNLVSADEIGGGTVRPPVHLTDDHILYMIGDDKGNFNPDKEMTRAETAMVFYRLLDDATDVTTGDFADVTADQWFATAVYTLAANDIITGYADGTFKPDNAVTRAEFATIAARFKDMAVGSKTFTDVPAEHWAQPYIASAYENNLIHGYPDGSFKPDNAIIRSEGATIVNALLNRVADKEYVDAAEDLIKFPDVSADHWAYYDIVEATNAHDYTRDENGTELWGAEEAVIEETTEEVTDEAATEENTEEAADEAATEENAEEVTDEVATEENTEEAADEAATEETTEEVTE